MLKLNSEAKKLFVSICLELSDDTKELFSAAVKELYYQKNTSDEGVYSEFVITVEDIKKVVSSLNLIKIHHGKLI